MELFIIRHAEATHFGMAESDGERALTERGRVQSRAVGAYLSAWKSDNFVCLSSSVLRAWQTAELAVGEGEVVREMWLRCGMQPEVATQELQVYAGFEYVGLVGMRVKLSATN